MSDEMFSRDEVLGGGLSRVRRARACLYLIEQEAARQADRRTRVMALATTPAEGGPLVLDLILSDDETMRQALPGEADAAYIESFRNARRVTAPATVRALARSVDSWKVLVPSDLPLRAEVLHQMSIRHTMPVNVAQRIAAAFEVGSPAFDAAYAAVAGAPVASAFAPAAGLFARLLRRGTTKD